MALRSSLLFILTVFNYGIVGEYSPFDMVDEYVRQFKLGINSLCTASDSFSHEQRDSVKEGFNGTLTLAAAEEYDFIIVGGGTAGLTLAHRLSEEPRWKILVLEAGGMESMVTQVPAVQPYLLNTGYTWGYKTCAQKNACLGMEGNQCTIIKGKALGGDSSINDMLYTRGHPRDYDIWADTGSPSWCWKDILPYFKKIENACLRDMDKKYRHYGGPIHLEDFHPTDSTLADHFLEAGRACGLDKIDYNGKSHIGLGAPQFISKRGKRFSVARAYLNPISERTNLEIRPFCQVLEILVSQITKEANGVMYISDGQMRIAKATKEIVLSAGAVNTAQLLMLSGIGPHKDLEKFGIHCTKDLPVGRNLKDQVAFLGLNFVYEKQHQEHSHEEPIDERNIDGHGKLDVRFDGPTFVPAFGLEDEDDIAHNYYHSDKKLLQQFNKKGPKIDWHYSHSDDDVVNYLKYGKGPLCSTGLQLVGFIKTELSFDKTEYPDIQLLLKRTGAKEACRHFKGHNVKKEIKEIFCKPFEGFTVEIVLLHPKSIGTMTLNDLDPLHQPYINPNLLSDEDEFDVGTVLAGIRKVLTIMDSPPMKKLGVKLVREKIPECDQAIFSDEYWKCAIRYLSVTKGQITGTAKMGPENSKDAVVDENLKVHGISKLRIADASIIPVSITGNLMAPEIMIGEKAANILKDCWTIQV